MELEKFKDAKDRFGETSKKPEPSDKGVQPQDRGAKAEEAVKQLGEKQQIEAIRHRLQSKPETQAEDWAAKTKEIEILLKGRDHQDEKAQKCFEETIGVFVKNGQSEPVKILHWIFRGLARGLVLVEQLETYKSLVKFLPPLQYFVECQENASLLEQTKKCAKMDLSEFRRFYFKEILQNEGVVMATNEGASEQWDHDYVYEIAGAADMDKTKELLNKDKGPTKIENTYVGMAESLAANADSPQAGRLIGYFLLMDGILSNKAYADEAQYVRFADPSDNTPSLNSTPRMRPKETLGSVRNRVIGKLESLEPMFFSLLAKGPFEKLQKYLVKKYKVNVSSQDQFYDRIMEIMEVIIKKAGFLRRAWFNWRMGSEFV